MDLLDPAGRVRRLRVGATPPTRASSTSSGRTRSGAATTPTPSTSTRRSTPTRTYRVRGEKGDAVYLSLTVYGGPDDGHYSERIVGTVNDRDARHRAGRHVRARPQPGAGTTGTWLQLEPDAVCRDHARLPRRPGARPARSSGTSSPSTRRRRTGSTTTPSWPAASAPPSRGCGTRPKIVPLALGEPNTVDEPYPVPQQTFGWAAGDAAYAMGSFDLADDEALVIEGRSPECAFWNLCLWNPFLHTYNYDYERVDDQRRAAAVRAPTARGRSSSPTVTPAIRTGCRPAGHPRGRIWFRWFYPSETPARPTTRVVKVPDVLGSETTAERPFRCRERGGDVADQARWEYLVRRMEATRPRSVACASLSERKRVASAGAVGTWRRRATDPAERLPLRRTGAVACGVVVIGSLLLVRVFAVTAPRLLLALGFTVFVVVIIWWQWRANEMDAADPMPVRNREHHSRPRRRHRSNAIAGAGRVRRGWLHSAASFVSWAALSVRKGGRCARPGAHPRHGPAVAPRRNRRLGRHPTPRRVAART